MPFPNKLCAWLRQHNTLMRWEFFAPLEVSILVVLNRAALGDAIGKKFTSFERQLHRYGFSKELSLAFTEAYPGGDVVGYTHTCFDPENPSTIKRRPIGSAPLNASPAELAAAAAEAAAIKAAKKAAKAAKRKAKRKRTTDTKTVTAVSNPPSRPTVGTLIASIANTTAVVAKNDDGYLSWLDIAVSTEPPPRASRDPDRPLPACISSTPTGALSFSSAAAAAGSTTSGAAQTRGGLAVAAMGSSTHLASNTTAAGCLTASVADPVGYPTDAMMWVSTTSIATHHHHHDGEESLMMMTLPPVSPTTAAPPPAKRFKASSNDSTYQPATQTPRSGFYPGDGLAVATGTNTFGETVNTDLADYLAFLPAVDTGGGLGDMEAMMMMLNGGAGGVEDIAPMAATVATTTDSTSSGSISYEHGQTTTATASVAMDDVVYTIDDLLFDLDFGVSNTVAEAVAAEPAPAVEPPLSTQDIATQARELLQQFQARFGDATVNEADDREERGKRMGATCTDADPVALADDVSKVAGKAAGGSMQNLPAGLSIGDVAFSIEQDQNQLVPDAAMAV